MAGAREAQPRVATDQFGRELAVRGAVAAADVAVVVARTDDAAAAAAGLPARTWINVGLMGAIYFLGQTAIFTHVSTTVVAARRVNPDLATLPFALVFAGHGLSAPLSGKYMRSHGWRRGFLLSGVIGAAANAVFWASQEMDTDGGILALMCLAGVMMGISNGVWNQIRFVAGLSVGPAYKNKATAYTIAGGAAAGILGPELSKQTRESFSTEFTATYFSLIFVFVAMSLLSLLVAFPATEAVKPDAPARRPYTEIFSNKVLLQAVVAGASAYAIMVALMSATPSAMADDFRFGQAADVVRGHVLAMFLPSFFSAPLISRFGPLSIITSGYVLHFIGPVVFVSGDDFENYLFGLILVGVGWNLQFLGATVLLAKNISKGEEFRVQSMNDAVVFFVVAAAVGSTSFILEAIEWEGFAVYGICLLVASYAAILALRPKA